MFKSAAFYAIFTDHSRGLLRLFYRSLRFRIAA